MKKQKIGIEGLDKMLEGGIPHGKPVLITGETGTGKTVLLNQFIYKGIKEFGQNGVFVTFEEHPEDIMKNISGFGWDYKPLIESNKLAFVDFSPSGEKYVEVDKEYDLSPIIERINYAIKKVKAKRVVIDSLASLFTRFSNKNAIRLAIFDICDNLKKQNITALISAEKIQGTNILQSEKIQEFVVDGVFELERKKGQQSLTREIQILKLRGTDYRSGFIEYEINKEGMVCYSKIPISTEYSQTDYKERKGFGVKKLDDALGGGIPKGHVFLTSGPTGTGKSLLGLHFIAQGIKEKENCIYVNLEEPTTQIKKSANQFGWDLGKYEKAGKLKFISQNLIDLKSDKLLYDIIDAIEKTNAKRIVIDSLSSLESGTYDKYKVREFLIQLYYYLKSKGVTAVLSFLTHKGTKESEEGFIASFESNSMRLSSVIDGVIMLDYSEIDEKVIKLFNVLKLRGSDHSKEIVKYEITEKGFTISDNK